MLTDLLQQYGFSEKEANIYLTSLEIGKAPASSIARKSGIKRVTVYSNLIEMEKKGRILSEDIAGVAYYTSTHPENLLKSLQAKIDEFEKALPELLAIMNKFSEIKGENHSDQPRRAPLKSQELRKNFPKIYEKFWQENDYVFSGNAIFTWGGGFGLSGSFNIKQKLPNKHYIGISLLESNDIQFTTSIEYDNIANTFKEIDISKDNRFSALKKPLLELLKNNNYFSGIKISMLTEKEQGLGVGYLSIAISIIVFAIYFLCKKINKEMLKDYDKFLTSEIFYEILNSSKNILDIPTKGKAYGANSYLVFSNTNRPQIYNKLPGIPLKFISKSLDDFFFLSDNLKINDLPFDYGYFFLGGEYNSNMRINATTNFKRKIDDKQTSLINLFKENNIPFIFSEKDSNFYQTFQNLFPILKMEILFYFGEVLKFPYNNEVFDQFISAINNYYKYSEIPQQTDPLIDLIQTKFNQYKYFNDENLGIFPIATGESGGSFGFVMKYKKSRETLKKVFDILQKEGHHKITVPYLSRIDGTSEDGVIIEKSLL